MGNDLFNLVKKDKIVNQTKFWGDYEHLNSVPHISNKVLFNYQISRLKALEASNVNLIRANKILNEFNKVSPVSIQGKTIEMSTNQIYSRILEILNSAFISSPSSVINRHLELKEGNVKRTYKAGHNKDTLQADKNSLIAELDALLQAIKYPNKDQVLYYFNKGLGNKKSGFGKFSNYMKYKSNEAENLMMYALSQASPSWRAIVSGQFFNKGEALLEDGLVFNDMDFNLKFDSNYKMIITSKNGNKKTKNVSSLQDFFNLLNGLSVNSTVSLEDELYQKLQELSILKAQSKSGFGIQELINKTVKRGSISLKDTGGLNALRQLYELYQKGWIEESYNNDNSKSKTLESLANYCLSKSIAATTLMGNDIYFTKDGFISASQWMQIYNYMLRFNPALNKITNDFLENKNPYRLAPVD